MKKLLAFLLFAFLLFSCSKQAIVFEPMPDWQQVNQGEDLKISWSVKNADYVKFEGVEGQFKTTDYIRVKPTGFTKYNIIAFSGKDSLMRTVRVTVLSGVAQDIKTGPEAFSKKSLSQSIKESDNLNGVLESSVSNGPTCLRIIRSVYPDANGEFFNIRFLLLDQFGNFISGLCEKDNKFNEAQIDYIASAESKDETYPLNNVSEIGIKFNQYLDLAVLFDNSLMSQLNNSVVPAMKECISYLTTDDNILLSAYNHNYQQLIPLNSVFKVDYEIDRMKMPKNEGLSALYKSAYKTLEQLSMTANPIKSLVVVTSTSDNASLFKEAGDVESLAKKLNIPVYFIAVGHAVSTYQLKYLCASTGGRYYQVETGNSSQIADILKEIALSNKIYYEAKIPKVQLKKGEKSRITIRYAFKDRLMLDACNIINRPSKQHIAYQSLATFAKDKSDFSNIYNELISELASVLKDNPTELLELSGNSSYEDNEQEQLLVSELRADNIKSALIENGAYPAQIKVKGVGIKKPIYYFESSPAQSEMNRRVDLRWLDARDMPFEIITDKFLTEDDAEKNVNSWAALGYKAYYQRITEKESIYYVSKLWGYATLEKASDIAKELSKKFKKNYYVE